MIYLNLGCGGRFHPDWINIDMAARERGIIRHDLGKGIPFSDEGCDAVYHAALLEHLRRDDAVFLLTECRRVLKPGGILRIGVPDFEKMCRIYLSKFSEVLAGNEKAAHDYKWIMLELFDQTVREAPGGHMKDYLKRNPLPNQRFVIERIGEEGRQLLDTIRRQGLPKKMSLSLCLDTLRKGLRAFPCLARRFFPLLFLGRHDRHALKIGRFRLSGEVHQWMYDRYSLAQLLESAGFCGIQVQEAGTSGIPDWDRYHLDTLPNGKPIKPDLFFMEAFKP